MLNVLWLNTFKTLVEIEHFTKTAQTLHMTQPGVTQHIRKLEDQLGTPLLDKRGKKFELTESGKKVYRFAVEHIEREAALRREIQVDSPYEGECHFAMSGSLCMQFQPLFIDRQLAHKGLRVFIEAAPNARIIESVLNSTIDVGVVTQNSATPQLEYTHIAEEKLCLIVPSNFNYAQWSFEDVYQLGLIDHPDCQHYLNQCLSAYELSHKLDKIKVNGYSNQLSQILNPVANGLGFTLLPTSAVNAYPQQSRIHVLPLNKAITEPLFLVHKRQINLPARYEWFINCLKSNLTNPS